MIEYLLSGVCAILVSYMVLQIRVSIEMDAPIVYIIVCICVAIVFGLMSIIQFVEVYKENHPKG